MTDSQASTKKWRRLLLIGATVVVFLLFAPHPELRLLLPFIDVVGVDLFLFLVASQAWSYFKPPLHRLYRSLVLPVLHTLYALVVFFLGIAGPYFDARFTSFFPNCELRSSSSFTLPLAYAIVGALIGPLIGNALHTSPVWIGPAMAGIALAILLPGFLLFPTAIRTIRSKVRNFAA